LFDTPDVISSEQKPFPIPRGNNGSIALDFSRILV